MCVATTKTLQQEDLDKIGACFCLLSPCGDNRSRAARLALPFATGGFPFWGRAKEATESNLVSLLRK